jgi:hypothetical protein
VAALSARSDIIVISQVNIEYQLSFYWREALSRASIGRTSLRVDCVYWAEIYFGRAAVLESSGEVIAVFEALIADENVTVEGEAKLAALEE